MSEISRVNATNPSTMHGTFPSPAHAAAASSPVPRRTCPLPPPPRRRDLTIAPGPPSRRGGAPPEAHLSLAVGAETARLHDRRRSDLRCGRDGVVVGLDVRV